MRERSQPRTEMVTYQMVSIAGVFEICLQDPSLPPSLKSECETSKSTLLSSSTSICSNLNYSVVEKSESTSAQIGRKRKIDQIEQNTDSTEWQDISQGSSNSLVRSRKLRSTHSPPPTTRSRFSSAFLSRNLLFKGFVQAIASSPTAELSLIDANQEEYVTRMTLDGVFLYADHR